MRVVVSGSSGLIGRSLRRRLASPGRRGDRAGAPAPGRRRGAVGPRRRVDRRRRARRSRRRRAPRRRRHRRQALVGGTPARDRVEPGRSRRRCWPGPWPSSRSPPTRPRRARRPSASTATAATRSSPRRARRGRGSWPRCAAAWEDATAPAAEAGVRVVHLRSGVVLSAHGGALARQLPLFRLGVGGRLGNGRQWLSWISLADEVGAILHALDDPALDGPGQRHRTGAGDQPRRSPAPSAGPCTARRCSPSPASPCASRSGPISRRDGARRASGSCRPS